MQDVCYLDERLKQSVRMLRAWRWMSTLSTDLQQIAAILNDEARDLIELGRQYPDHAKRIGKLIVAYRNAIVQLREQATSTDAATA